MPDNIAYQASRGNWIIEEDGGTGDFIDGSRNNDIWDCLGDGADDDTLSDGCVRIATLNDLDCREHRRASSMRPASTTTSASSTTRAASATILDITGWGSQARATARQ